LLIIWLTGFVFMGLLLAWQPALWAVSAFQIAIFGVAAVALVRYIRRPSGFRVPLDVVAVCLLACWGPAQILLHGSVYAYDTWNASVQWLALAATYVTARSLAGTRESRQQFLSIVLWAGLALGIVCVILHFSSPQRVYGLFVSRFYPYGPFVYKNQFSAFLELLLPIAFFRLTSARRGKVGYAIVFAALFACIVASLSRAGLAIAVLEILVLSIVSWRRRIVSGTALLKFGLPILLLMAVFTLIVGTGSMTARFGEKNILSGIRQPLAESTLQMIEARPGGGFGLGTWRLVYPQFATFDVAAVANEAHDDWLQWASEGGIPFALILLVLAAWLTVLASKHLWGLGVPAMFLHCLFDYPTRLPALAAFLFLVAGALAATAGRNRNDKTEAPPSTGWSVLSVRENGRASG
jgi:O-antigen ligase